jgi:hypothetical protein
MGKPDAVDRVLLLATGARLTTADRLWVSGSADGVG